jgi:hypothetical protein
MKDPIAAQRAKVAVQPDASLDPGGATRRHRSSDYDRRQNRRAFHQIPTGYQKENPLSVEAVSAKTHDLMAPVLGGKPTG